MTTRTLLGYTLASFWSGGGGNVVSVLHNEDDGHPATAPVRHPPASGVGDFKLAHCQDLRRLPLQLQEEGGLSWMTISPPQ